MQLNKDKLIDTARSGIERAKDLQDEWDQNVNDAEMAHDENWVKYQLPLWRDFRDHLTKALRTGGHVSADMLPVTREYGEFKGPLYRPFNRGKIGRHGDWNADHSFGPRPVLKIAAFESLIAFLETVEDTSISTTQLERAGFRNLDKLFVAAANGYWD